MKAKLLTMSMQYTMIIALMVLFSPVSISQQADAAGIDPVEYFERMKALEPDPPVFFTTRTGLTPAEMHQLDILTHQERNLIEMEVHPPAIGIIRDLRPSIYFNLSQTEIPREGEVTVSGGRLGWVNPDTLVFTTRIGSQKADEIRVFFAEGYFPPGVMVNTFSDYDDALTEIQLRGQIDEYGFYTTTTFADHVIIQVVIPSEVIKEELYFEITKLIHVDYEYLPEDFRDCFLDANCATANSFAGIDQLRRSTGRLLFPVGSLYYFCTGNQINDTRAKDWQPFLLTANHCFSTQTSAAGLEARFYYWSTSCNSGVVNPSHIIRNGANLIATNSQTDFTLVLMKQYSANYFLGWTTAAVANNTVLHSTHHPGGTFMKYQRMQNKTSPNFTCGGFSTANYHYTQTTHGQEAGGSSGSATVDADLRIRGQLYGWCFLSGADRCSYTTYYNMWGRFNVSYANNNLQYWLNSGGASVAMGTSPVSSLGYGNVTVGSFVNLNVTVTNTGTRPNFMNLEAGNATITGTNANQFSIIGSNFLYLAPGESGTFTIRFTPTSAGAKTATLTIPHNADNITSPRTITLTGTGVANPCSDIISLGSGGSANTRTFSKSGTGAWNTNACGWSTPGPEQVYSFVAPFTGNYSIQVTATNSTYVNYFWKSGSCSPTGWNCISDVLNPGVYGNFSLTAGQTYHILLDSETTALATHTFFIFYNPCQNITNIAGTGAANTQTYTGGGSGAWFTTTASPCGYVCPGVENIFSFTPTQSGIYQIEVTAASGWVNYMWKSGACNAENWECISDLSTPGVYGNMNMTAGVTYLILLDDENTTPGTHQFFIRPPVLPGTWIGTLSTNWHTAGNWSDGAVPIVSTNVTIPAGTPFSPVVSNPATCNNITVMPDATLTITGNGLTVVNSFFVDGTLVMNNPNSFLSVGQSHLHWLEFRTGSTAALTDGTIHCYGWVIPRNETTFNLPASFTIYFKGNSGGGPSNQNPSANYGSIIIDKNAGENAFFDSSSTQPLSINGNFTISAQNKFIIQNQNVFIQGTVSDHATSEIFLGTASKSDFGINSSEMPKPDDPPLFRGGLLEIDTDFTLNGLLDIGVGDVLVKGRLASTSSSSILINGGSLVSDAPNHGDKGWQYIAGNLTLSEGLFQITNNSLHLGSTATTSISGGTIRSAGAFSAIPSGVFQPTGGVVEIIGDQPDALLYCYDGNHFYDLRIDRSGGFSRFAGSGSIIQNNLYVDHGELEIISSFNLTVNGNMEVNSGGIMKVLNQASLLIGDGRSVTVNSGGTLELIGNSAANRATMGRISSGHYALNIESGGTLAAQNAIFEYMNTNGVHIKSGATVDATKAFTNSMFRNGQSGGRLLTIHNNQTFTVLNADFPANTWGGAYNVFKDVNQGNVTFTGYTGPFSGSAFEFDPNNRIHWTVDAFTLTFTVNDSNGNSVSDAVVTLNGTPYPAGTYVFNDLVPGVYNYSISRSCYQSASGQVTIVASNVTQPVVLTNIPGDANNDGLVNVSDVVVIVNYYMGESPSPFCFNNADVNNDDVINVQDVVGTVNIFMGGKMNPWIDLNSSVAYLHLKPDGITIESDGTLAGIQFELTGNKLDEMELISRLQGHAMTYKVVDGKLRVLIFSIDNTPIPAGTIPLADFKNAAEDLQWDSAVAANLNADAVDVILLTEPLGWRNAGIPEGLRVYPNPVNDVLWVEFQNNSGKPAQVTLSNMHAQQITAQKVIEQGAIMVSFRMNELAPGVYFIRVDIDGKYFYEKIIVK